MASFASSATTGSAHKHAWTKKLIFDFLQTALSLRSLNPPSLRSILFLVVLFLHNLLYIIFQTYLWTVERNLDTDLDCEEVFTDEHKTEKMKVDKGAGKRRHSLAATLHFLHLK